MTAFRGTSRGGTGAFCDCCLVRLFASKRLFCFLAHLPIEHSQVDKNIFHTAIREMVEEIGLRPADIDGGYMHEQRRSRTADLIILSGHCAYAT
jgi:8-oxo-dGTP pyrophosphatase MutT (NUDIX family)